ncbi:MAG: SCO family protein [Arenimonas sp.]|jgi:protein SCO1/2
MKRLLRCLVGSLALAAGLSTLAAPANPLPSDSVYQLDVPMVDQSGRSLNWRDQRGRPRVVSMFYSSCPYICPLIVDSGKAIEHALTPAERARLGITLVSLDPKRDTPRALAALAARRQLDPARWTLLRPAERDVRAIAGVLSIRYRALADGEFNHTSVLILLDADGRVLARTEQIGTRLEPSFVAAVRRAVAASAKPKPRAPASGS